MATTSTPTASVRISTKHLAKLHKLRKQDRHTLRAALEILIDREHTRRRNCAYDPFDIANKDVAYQACNPGRDVPDAGGN